MKCIECKYFAGTANDQYGVCKRYPVIQNKSQHDWCGEYVSKVCETPASIEEQKEKRGRKPKNDN